MNIEEKRARFKALHVKGSPLIMPNPADQGSARVLANVGFAALATTSGGFGVAIGAVVRAGRQLLEEGSDAWMDLAAEGRNALAAAFR